MEFNKLLYEKLYLYNKNEKQIHVLNGRLIKQCTYAVVSII